MKKEPSIRTLSVKFQGRLKNQMWFQLEPISKIGKWFEVKGGEGS